MVESMEDRMNEVACDSFAFADFDVDGAPHPRLAKISGAYLDGSITRKEYRAQMEEAVEELSKDREKYIKAQDERDERILERAVDVLPYLDVINKFTIDGEEPPCIGRIIKDYFNNKITTKEEFIDLMDRTIEELSKESQNK